MIRRVLSGCFAIAVLAAATAPLLAADECRADIDGTLERVDEGNSKTVFSGKVTVTVHETCADVNFDLVVVEDRGAGKKKEKRVAKQIRIRDSTPGTMQVEYRLKAGRTVAEHRWEQTGCRICD
ncbi:MAG: hypothetical protein GY716_14720 [bacterium]|nr:hypothetical protein [bacterium]